MLDTILNDADSIVKFTAILLSASLAFIGVLLSQWRTRVREDRANRRSKCEEMVIDLSTITLERHLLINHANTYCNTVEAVENRSDKTKEYANKVVALSIKVDMLLDLYLPEIKKEERVATTSIKGYLIIDRYPAINESSEKRPYPESIIQWEEGGGKLKRLRKDIVNHTKKLT